MNESDGRREQGTAERVGEQVGAAAGRAMGRGTEWAAGMIGSALSSAVDNLGAWWSSMDASRAADSFAQQDQSCRSHFQSGATDSTRSYDDVRPLYQFGHVAGQNPSYRGRSFDEVEPDLEGAWDEDLRRAHGDWPEVRTYINWGYGQNTGNMRDF